MSLMGVSGSRTRESLEVNPWGAMRLDCACRGGCLWLPVSGRAGSQEQKPLQRCTSQRDRFAFRSVFRLTGKGAGAVSPDQQTETGVDRATTTRIKRKKVVEDKRV